MRSPYLVSPEDHPCPAPFCNAILPPFELPQRLLEVPDRRGRRRDLAAQATEPREPLDDVQASKGLPGLNGRRARCPDQPLDLPRKRRGDGTQHNARVSDGRVHGYRYRPHSQDSVALRRKSRLPMTRAM